MNHYSMQQKTNIFPNVRIISLSVGIKVGKLLKALIIKPVDQKLWPNS